ncbi:hypothetical protein DNTS_028783, partial [Danionella cerebrum]
MMNSKTFTVIILLSIFMARGHTKDFRELMFVEGTDATLLCDTKLNWDEFIFVVWNIRTQGKTCYYGLSKMLENTCNDGKKLLNSTEGISLYIPKISMKDEGSYSCDLSYKGGSYGVNVSVI